MNDRSPFRCEPEKQRGKAESRGAGVPPAVFLPRGSTLNTRSRRLPHWEVKEAVYFVTFRLADSLPSKALQKVIFQHEDIPATAKQMNRTLTPSERTKEDQLRARRIEKVLDAGEGECFLRNPKVAQIVVNVLKEFDGSRYRLFAWCVMPNHVHALFQTIGNASLANILHSWKSYSAKVANGILGRDGEFWQREYHDRLVRNAEEFERLVRYVMENPSSAGLRNWPWVWSSE
jgi:REP element-mobilizing transposase RayT